MIVVPLDSSNKLDATFQQHLIDIEKHYLVLPKDKRIRVEQWVRKLCEITTLDTWKRNRNQYSRLLLAQIQQKRLADPFHSLPPDGGLKTLPIHLANSCASLSVTRTEPRMDC